MRPLAFALVVLVLSGCGSGGASPASKAEREQEWATGAALLLDGLDEALTRVANAGVSRLTLENTSTLYEALLGYTFIGGCGEVLAKLGEPAPRQDDLRDQLRRACAHLEHASNVFTRAVQRKSATLLAAAAREALGTASVLQRARELLKEQPVRTADSRSGHVDEVHL
jgi:hypothetical protein